MNIDAIQASFKSAVADSIQLHPQGADCYQIFTPFQFADGDHFVIALHQKPNGNLVLTDNGHTYMHMSYRTDLSKLNNGTRNTLIENALARHKVMEYQGEIFAEIDDLANAGNVLYNFIQCLSSIVDVAYLDRERVPSLFKDDFVACIKENVEPDRVTFDYCDSERDPHEKYPVDCRINGMSRPLHIYGINNDNKCRDTTIYIMKSLEWGIPFLSIGIFEDQEQISRKVLSRFTDVCDRQFSSLVINREKIASYLQDMVG